MQEKVFDHYRDQENQININKNRRSDVEKTSFSYQRICLNIFYKKLRVQLIKLYFLRNILKLDQFKVIVKQLKQSLNQAIIYLSSRIIDNYNQQKMKARHDSSFGDLLPWQTADSNLYATNFIQNHTATIAQMTSAPDNLNHSKSAYQKHRILTAITPSKIAEASKYRSKDRRKSNEDKSSKYIENGSRQKLKNLLYNSLSPQKLKKVMETAESSSPIKVTQLSTEQSSSSNFTQSSIRTSELSHSGIHFRDAAWNQNHQVQLRRITFADFVEENKRRNRGGKAYKTYERDCEAEYTYQTIHSRPKQPRQSLAKIQQAFKAAEALNYQTHEQIRAPSSKRKLVSSKRMERSKHQFKGLSNYPPSTTKLNDLGLFLQI